MAYHEDEQAPQAWPGSLEAGQTHAAEGVPAVTATEFLATVIDDRPGHVALALTGDLDLSSRDELWRVITAIIETRRPASLVLDLSGVAFADCSGLSVLIRAQQRLAGHEGQLICANAQPIVRRLMSLRGVGSHLRLREADDIPAELPQARRVRRGGGD